MADDYAVREQELDRQHAERRHDTSVGHNGGDLNAVFDHLHAYTRYRGFSDGERARVAAAVLRVIDEALLDRYRAEHAVDER